MISCISVLMRQNSLGYNTFLGCKKFPFVLSLLFYSIALFTPLPLSLSHACARIHTDHGKRMMKYRYIYVVLPEININNYVLLIVLCPGIFIDKLHAQKDQRHCKLKLLFSCMSHYPVVFGSIASALSGDPYFIITTISSYSTYVS